MKRALCLLALFALAVPRAHAAPLAASPAPSPAPLASATGNEDSHAGEDQPPTLASRIPPVSGRAFGIADRLELTPGIGFSLGDPFISKYLLELSLGYHLSQAVYLGLRGGYALSTSSGLVASCSGQGAASVCGPPSTAQLRALPGEMSLMGFAELGWTPVYGKLHLFADRVVHFDLSALFDAGVIVVGTPAAPDGTFAAGTMAALAIGPGLGERLFLTDELAISAELRDYLYDVGGLRGQFIFNLGLAIFFGGSPPGAK